jgi:hypothetical protein
VTGGGRIGIPCPAVQQAAIRLLVTSNAIGTPTTPLLEEEGNVLCIALTSYGIDPEWFHRSGLGAGFSTDDDPMNARKIEFPDVLKQWFDRQKADACGNLAQVVNPRDAIFFVLD